MGENPHPLTGAARIRPEVEAALARFTGWPAHRCIEVPTGTTEFDVPTLTSLRAAYDYGAGLAAPPASPKAATVHLRRWGLVLLSTGAIVRVRFGVGRYAVPYWIDLGIPMGVFGAEGV